jgi:hypothetical protein
VNTARNIRKSAMQRVREILASPPAGSGLGTPYTLYDIADLRLAWKNQLTQARPSAFVIEGRIKPMEVVGYPLIMVSTQVTYRPFELGNTNGGLAVIDLNVVGRMSGERDDLAAVFAKSFGRSLAIYNYSSGSNGVLIEKAPLTDEIKTWDDEVDTDAVRAGGSYDYWEVVRLQVEFISA